MFVFLFSVLLVPLGPPSLLLVLLVLLDWYLLRRITRIPLKVNLILRNQVLLHGQVQRIGLLAIEHTGANFGVGIQTNASKVVEEMVGVFAFNRVLKLSKVHLRMDYNKDQIPV